MSLFRRARPAELTPLWSATVPGTAAHTIACDAVTGSVYVGSGWGVAYPSLAVHRLSLRSGDVLATARTRHQFTGALLPDDRSLWVPTDSRLFRMDGEDLTVTAEWDERLVRYTQRLVRHGDRLVMANWRAPTVGLFDPATGATKRVKAGPQPIVFRLAGRLMVAAGFDGGIAELDAGRGRLGEWRATPPLSRVAAGADAWAVLAGPPTGGQGDPPVWVRSGTRDVVRLTGEPTTVRLPGEVAELACDDAARVVWCMLRETVVAVSQDTGAVVATHAAPAGTTFVHLDAAAGVALATASPTPAPDADVATLHRCGLPTV